MEKEQVQESLSSLSDSAKQLLNSENAVKARKIGKDTSSVLGKIGRGVLYLLTVLAALAVIYYCLSWVFCGHFSNPKPTFKEYRENADSSYTQKMAISKRFKSDIEKINDITGASKDDIVDLIFEAKRSKDLGYFALGRYVSGMLDFVKDGNSWYSNDYSKRSSLAQKYAAMFDEQYNKAKQEKAESEKKGRAAKIKAVGALKLALYLICTLQFIAIARNTSKKENC